MCKNISFKFWPKRWTVTPLQKFKFYYYDKNKFYLLNSLRYIKRFYLEYIQTIFPGLWEENVWYFEKIRILADHWQQIDRGYKCTTLWHDLFVRGQLFSLKITGRSRNSCQVIWQGAGNDFHGLYSASRAGAPSPHVSLSRAPFFSVPMIYYLQVPATQAQASQKSIKLCISFEIINMKEGFLEPLTEFPLSVTTVRLD